MNLGFWNILQNVLQDKVALAPFDEDLAKIFKAIIVIL
jgi:hypothetical protein